MKDIPDWIVRMVEADNLYCNKCRKTLKVEHIISMGVHESSVEPYDDKLCIGVSCPDCKDVTIFELKEMTLVEFAFEILDKGTKPSKPKKKIKDSSVGDDILKEMIGKKPTRKKSVNKKSKITKKEVNEVRRFLNSAKTHEDVLVAMGLSPEQISKYSYKKGKDK
jgi:hypothetical protein